MLRRRRTRGTGKRAGCRLVHLVVETFGDALVDHCAGNLDEARLAAEDQYAGTYALLAEFAQEITEETTQIPASLRNYIDYEAMARDIDLNGDVFTIETGHCEVHVFWCR